MAFGASQFPLRIPVEAVDRFSIPFGRIAGALEGFGRKAEKIGRKLTVGLTAPLAAFGFASARTGLEFQRGLNRVQVVTGATAEEVEGLQQRIEGALGAKGIPTTARESAAAMLELAQSTHSLVDVEMILPGAIALATAASVDQAEAAAITTDILDAYGLSAQDAASVTDLLALATARGEQQLEPLAEGIVEASRAAKAFDQDLPGTIAALDRLADKGKKGAAGAQVFGQMLAKLRAPSTSAQRALHLLGIDASNLAKRGADGALRMRPFEEILGLLKARGLDAGKSLDIFGPKLGATALGLVRTADEAQAFADELHKAGGTAERLAKVQLGGGIAPLEEFRQKWERLLVTIARSGLLEGLGALATKAGQVFEWVAKLDPAILRWGIRLGAVAAIAGPALVFVGQLSAGLAGLAKLGGALGLARLGPQLAGILGAAAPWAALAVSIGVIAFNVKNLLDTLAGRVEPAGGPRIDRPAMDEFAFPAGPAAGASRVRAVGAGGPAAAGAGARAEVSGRIQVDLQGLPPGARVRTRQTGDVPIDVDAGYVLAAGLSG